LPAKTRFIAGAFRCQFHFNPYYPNLISKKTNFTRPKATENRAHDPDFNHENYGLTLARIKEIGEGTAYA
jgi:hypothetical protein